MKRRKSLWLSGLFGLGLVATFLFGQLPFAPSTIGSQPVEAQTVEELRGFWVDAFHPGIKSPSEVDKLIADVKKANANAIFAQVRRRGDAYYNSNIEPRTNDPNLVPGFDALDYLIDRAHAEGIEVHAWMVTLPVYKEGGVTTTAPSHVWQQHGPNAPGRDNWAMMTLGGEAPGFLDPGHPEVADYTISVYLDVLRNYDVDGLHLDYIRYDGTDWGYNPTAVARFRKETNRTDTPAPSDPQWSQWRRDRVTDLVRGLYQQATAIDPDVKISAAVIAWGEGPSDRDSWYRTRTYSEVYQDWRGWLEEGIIDLAIPMTYHRDGDPNQRVWYDRWVEFAKNNQYDRHVAIGVGAYLNSSDSTISQLRRAQAPSRSGQMVRGQVIYSYANSNLDAMEGDTYSNDRFYGMLPQVWRSPARIPDMPWKRSVATSSAPAETQ